MNVSCHKCGNSVELEIIEGEDMVTESPNMSSEKASDHWTQKVEFAEGNCQNCNAYVRKERVIGVDPFGISQILSDWR